MPVSNHLSITPPQEESRRNISGERPEGFGVEAVRLLSKPLPFSAQRRNLLALLLFFATVAWFWQPLVTLFSLTQQQEHYSHIVLIPCLSLYVLFLDRKAILASREWSPWLGSLVIGMGALGYWRADPATFAADQLSTMILALVVMCWGIFVSSFVLASLRGSTLWRGFSEVGSTGGDFPFAKIHSRGERPTRSAVCTSSPLRSLRPRWTAILSILRAVHLLS